MSEEGELIRWFDCSSHMKEPSDVAIHGREYYICDFKAGLIILLLSFLCLSDHWIHLLFLRLIVSLSSKKTDLSFAQLVANQSLIFRTELTSVITVMFLSGIPMATGFTLQFSVPKGTFWANLFATRPKSADHVAWKSPRRATLWPWLAVRTMFWLWIHSTSAEFRRHIFRWQVPPHFY